MQVRLLASSWLLALSGCASPMPPSAAPPSVLPAPASTAPVIRHFAGTMSVSSPDGKTPYGPPKKSVVTRTITPSAGTVVERVAQDGGKVNVTTLVRRGVTNIFDATDDAHSFVGTITFAGDPFAMTTWTYAITMKDGSTIRGTGAWNERGVHTEKTFASPDGTPKVRIVDELPPASEAEAATAEHALAPAPAPPAAP